MYVVTLSDVAILCHAAFLRNFKHFDLQTSSTVTFQRTYCLKVLCTGWRLAYCPQCISISCNLSADYWKVHTERLQSYTTQHWYFNDTSAVFGTLCLHSYSLLTLVNS